MSNFVTGHLVQNRLRPLADDAKLGIDKIKSKSGGVGVWGWGSVDVFVNNRVNWPHKFVLSGQKIKMGGHTTSCPPSNGWQASAEPSGRNPMCRPGKICWIMS